MKTYIVNSRHNCVSFDDLPEPLKSSVLSQYAVDETCYNWWETEIDYFCDEVTEKYGIGVDGRNCYFSLYPTSATWAFSHIDNFEKLMDALGVTDAAERAFLVFCQDCYGLRFDTAGRSWSLCQNASLEWWTVDEDEVDDPADLQGMDNESQEKFFLRLENAWYDLCQTIAHELASLLEAHYEYVTSEEYLRERMEDNGDIFDVETGEVFHVDEAEESDDVDVDVA